jgi:large repetitive protein
MVKRSSILIFLACLAISIAGLGQSAPAQAGTGFGRVLLAPLLETDSDDLYTTNEDTQLVVDPPGVLGNDGDVTDLALVTDVTNGTLVLNLSDGSFTYDPDPDYFGADSFVYSVVSNEVTQDFTASITVDPVNDAPSFTLGSDPTVLEDSTAFSQSGWATGISPGPANESDQTSSFTLTPANPDLFSVQPALDATTGELSFTPALNANGSTTVDVSLQDSGGTANGGADTATGSFTISITAVNDAPTLTPGSNPTVLEDVGAVTLSGWATGISPGPADESTQSLSISLTAVNAALFSAQPAIDLSNGALTFTPAANANGSTTVNYTLQDNGGTANGGDDNTTGSFSITITPVNDPPTFTLGPDPFVVESSDPPTTYTYTGWATGITRGPANESTQSLTFTVIAAQPALFSVQPAINPATGTLTFTPAPGAYTNPDTSVYVTLRDDGGTANGGIDSAMGNFTITINDYPTTVDDPLSTIEDAEIPAASFVLDNDFDVVGGIDEGTLDITQQGSKGTAVVVDLLTQNPFIEYLPAPDEFGVDIVRYEICDHFGYCSIGRVNVQITAVNDPPEANDDTYYMLQNTTLSIAADQGLLANDTDVEQGTILETSLTAIQISTPPVGTLNANPDGSFSFTPPLNYIGSVQFTYRAFDGTLPSDDTATVTINVSTNIPPIAQNDAYTLDEDTTLDVPAPGVLANDSDPDGGPLTAALESPPSHGALTLNSNGSFTYTPEANYYGTDSFTYRARDYLSGSLPATVTLTINPVNDPPVANDDFYTLNLLSASQGGNLVAAFPGVLANDIDVDPDDVLVASLLTAPTIGTVVLDPDGSFVYIPDMDGEAVFTYQVSDGTATDSATVRITIDMVAPTVVWVEPDTSPFVMQTSRETLGLQVTPSDSSGINRVEYKYFNVPQAAWITVASATSSPWSAGVLSGILNPGWSDIRAWVYDQNGNLTVSERVIIWRPLEIFMPRVTR